MQRSRKNQKVKTFIHDFRCNKADDMYYYELKEKMKYFKEVKGGNEKMYKIFDEIKQEGRIESDKAFLLNTKLSIKKIADCTSLPLELAENLTKEIRK